MSRYRLVSVPLCTKPMPQVINSIAVASAQESCNSPFSLYLTSVDLK